MITNTLFCLIMSFGLQQNALPEISPDQPELANNLKLRIQRLNLLGEAPRYLGVFESTRGGNLIVKTLSVNPDNKHWLLLWDRATPNTFELTLRKHDQVPDLSIIAILELDQKELNATWSNLLSPTPIPQLSVSNPSTIPFWFKDSRKLWALILLMVIATGCACMICLGTNKSPCKTDLNNRIKNWLANPQQHHWEGLGPILDKLKESPKADSILGEKIKAIEQGRFSGQDPDIQKIRELLQQHPSVFNE